MLNWKHSQDISYIYKVCIQRSIYKVQEQSYMGCRGVIFSTCGFLSRSFKSLLFGQGFWEVQQACRSARSRYKGTPETLSCGLWRRHPHRRHRRCAQTYRHSTHTSSSQTETYHRHNYTIFRTDHNSNHCRQTGDNHCHKTQTEQGWI